MDVVDLVARVRDHFIEQFGSFVEQQQARFKLGSAEVKLELDEDSAVFGGLYCVDFIRPVDDEEDEDDEDGVVEFDPAFFLQFEPASGAFGGMEVLIEQLHWHDIVIHHDLKSLPEDAIDDWFEAWFDPEDERFDPEARFAGVIHSLVIADGKISIDFGTAHAAAFWDMLELLEGAGATQVRIGSGDEEGEG